MKRRKGLWLLAVACLTATTAGAGDCADRLRGRTVRETNKATTPCGMTVRMETVYAYRETNKKKQAERPWHDDECRFHHGNAPVRLAVTNPTDAAQGLRVELAFRTRGGAFHSGLFGSPGEGALRLIATTAVPPGAETEWDIPVPCVANLFADFRADGGVTLTDATGRVCPSVAWPLAAGNPYAALYNLHRDFPDAETFFMHGPSPRIALTPSVDAGALQRAYERAMMRRAGATQKEIDRKFDGDSHSFDYSLVETVPDFSRFRRWQDLSVYDVIVLAEADGSDLPERFLSLLPDWVAAGGRLILTGEKKTGSTGLEKIDRIENSEDNPVNPNQNPVHPVFEEGPFGLGQVARMEAIDGERFADFVQAAVATLSHRGPPPRLECDKLAKEAVQELRAATPALLILGVLLAFCVVAGPVVLGILKRKNKRINILWVFPCIAVAFSLAVAAVIVFVNGVEPELRQFAYTLIDERAGKVVTVQHDVILAPFPVREPITYPSDAVVHYFSGDPRKAGEVIVYDGASFGFLGGWTPALWPVSFRTITVRDLAKTGLTGLERDLQDSSTALGQGTDAAIESQNDNPVNQEENPVDFVFFETDKDLGVVTRPIAGRLQLRTIRHTVERRAAE